MLLMVRCVFGSIRYGGPIELVLVSASAPRLVYVLSCVWDDAYKNPCCYSERVAHVAAAGFLSRYLSGSLP